MKTVIYGSSIKGNGHFISGTECQDSNSFEEKDFSEDEIKVVALSDGHGGAPYCRSSKGSKFAVNIAKEKLYSFVSVIKPFLDEIDSAQKIIDELLASPVNDVLSGEENLDAYKNSFDVSFLKIQIEALQKSIGIEFESIKENIVKAWNEAVDKDFLENPVKIIGAKISTFDSIEEEPKNRNLRGYGDVSQNNINFINIDLPLNIVDSIEKNPRQLYGATLLAMAQYKEHIFVLQVGDGDITVIDEDDNVDYPIKKAEHMLANETDSLCQKDVINRFNLLYFRRKIKIALLNTDGISNALENEQALSVVAQGIYQNINEEPDTFRSTVKPFLRMFSKASQDDCTFCFIANGVSEEAYDILKNSVETEEEHNLDSTYQPMFEKYALNRDLYILTQAETDGDFIISSVDFSGVGQTALKESFMKEQYIDLLESKRELRAVASQRKLMFDIISYGMRYLDTREHTLNNFQKDAYCDKINDILLKNPLKLIVFKAVTFRMDEDLILKKKAEDERYSIVLGEIDDAMLIQDVTSSVFDVIRKEFNTLVTFSADLPITEACSLRIRNYDITLIKEK